MGFEGCFFEGILMKFDIIVLRKIGIIDDKLCLWISLKDLLLWCKR